MLLAAGQTAGLPAHSSRSCRPKLRRAGRPYAAAQASTSFRAPELPAGALPAAGDAAFQRGALLPPLCGGSPELAAILPGAAPVGMRGCFLFQRGRPRRLNGPWRGPRTCMLRERVLREP